MARIRNWGELDYSIYNEFDHEWIDEGWQIWLVVRLDKPIEISSDLQVVGVSRQDIDEEDPEHLLHPVDASITINNGEIEEGMVFPNIIPSEFTRAFLAQESYRTVWVDLDQYDRHFRGIPMPANSYDLGIGLVVEDRVCNPDRFLQSFARKLNNWLAKAKTTK